MKYFQVFRISYMMPVEVVAYVEVEQERIFMKNLLDDGEACAAAFFFSGTRR
jgi:hypothetical protein